MKVTPQEIGKQESWDQRIAREKGERNILKQRLVSIASRLNLKVLNDNDPYEAFLRTSHKNGFNVWFRADQYHCKGKINIGVSFNDTANEERIYFDKALNVPDINEALTKDTETIAKNIEKRLFPKAIESQKAIDEMVQTALKKNNKRETGILELANLVGLEVPHHQHRDKPSIHGYRTHGNIILDVSTYYDGEKFKIELDDLSFEQTKQILNVVKEWKV